MRKGRGWRGRRCGGLGGGGGEVSKDRAARGRCGHKRRFRRAPAEIPGLRREWVGVGVGVRCAGGGVGIKKGFARRPLRFLG